MTLRAMIFYQYPGSNIKILFLDGIFSAVSDMVKLAESKYGLNASYVLDVIPFATVDDGAVVYLKKISEKVWSVEFDSTP